MSGARSSAVKFDDCQTIIANNAELVYSYLQELAEHGQLLTLIKQGERLFFTPRSSDYASEGVTQQLAALDVFFSNEEIYKTFNEMAYKWVPALTEENILATRKKMRDYFFAPLKTHSGIMLFLSLQNTELSKLHDVVAGSFVYRITMSWLPNRLKEIEEEKKIKAADADNLYTAISEEKTVADMLTAVMNNERFPRAIVLSQEKLLSTQLTQELELVFRSINTGESDSEEITNRLKKMRSTLKFKALEGSNLLLCAALHPLIQLIDDKHSKTKEKVAQILFDFVVDSFVSEGKVCLNGGVVAEDAAVKDASVKDAPTISFEDVKKLLANIEDNLDKDAKRECAYLLGKSDETKEAAEMRRKATRDKRAQYQLAKKSSSGFFSKSRSLLMQPLKALTASVQSKGDAEEEALSAVSPPTSPRTPRISSGQHDKRREMMRRRDSRKDVREVFFQPGQAGEESVVVEEKEKVGASVVI